MTIKEERFDMDTQKVTITCAGLVKSYPVAGDASTTRTILKDISLDVHRGELISVVGPSGSGKSTLLYCLSGLEEIDSGSISLCGFDISSAALPDISRFRREKVGFIFQSLNLIQSLSAVENVMLPSQLLGRKPDRLAAESLLSRLGLGEQIDSKPNKMSGGEQQRVAVARILFNQSEIVFADEPTGALDSRTSEVVTGLLRATAESGATVVIVTHDLELAAKSDRVLVLFDGVIHKTLIKPTAREVFETLSSLSQH